MFRFFRKKKERNLFSTEVLVKILTELEVENMKVKAKKRKFGEEIVITADFVSLKNDKMRIEIVHYRNGISFFATSAESFEQHTEKDNLIKIIRFFENRFIETKSNSVEFKNAKFGITLEECVTLTNEFFQALKEEYLRKRNLPVSD